MTAIDTVAQIQSRFATISAPGTATKNGTSAALFAQLVASMTAATSTSSASNAVTGQQIVDSANKYLGVPYVFGGTDSSGIDCSGLVQTSLADVGIKVDRVVQDQENDGVAVPSLAQAQPGDLIVLDGGEHIVIYEGNGKVIHAPETGRNVQEAPVWFTDADIVTIRRVAPTAGTAAAAPPAQTSSVTALQALVAAQTASANSLQALIAAQSAMLAGGIK